MHRIFSIVFPGLFMLLAFGASIRSCYQSYEYPYPKVSGEVKEKIAFVIERPKPSSETYIIERLANGNQEKHDWPDPKFMTDSSYESQKGWRTALKQNLSFNHVAYPLDQKEATGEYLRSVEAKGDVAKDTLVMSDTTMLVYAQGIYRVERKGFELEKGDSTFLLYGLTEETLSEIELGEGVVAYFSDPQVTGDLTTVSRLEALNPLFGPWKRTDKNEWMLFAFFGVFSLVVFAIALSKGGTER